MEDGKASSVDGMIEAQAGQASAEAARLLKEEIESLSSAGSSHKRTISGSILSRFAFLRPSTESRTTGLGNNNGPSAAGATAIPQQNPPPSVNRRTRSRRGSLRKTALLGGGKLRSNEKRLQMNADALLKPEDGSFQASGEIDSSPVPASPPDSDDYPTPRPSYDNKSLNVDDVEGSTQFLQTETDRKDHSNTSEESLPLPGALGRKTTIRDMSTTDEDESSKHPYRLLTAPPSSSGSSSVAKKHVAADAGYPFDTSNLQRRRSSHRPRAKSPLAALPIEPVAAPPEEWDYSETERWGWVILILTWVVFVMGMGSCFGVWSWAWDVGETPYAPPELEDDPTLPIVGYYPALIILTGVMAWVWVVVAWVGMKYFRHAKMAGDV